MLLILDIDGVLTDGKKYYDATGRAVLKTYCDRDFTAIKKFKAAGWKVVFLSGDPNINEAMARNRNIPFYCNRVDGQMINKVNFLTKIKTDQGINCDNIAYVGDDVFDIDLLKAVKWPMCPANADVGVKKVSCVLYSKSGDSVVAEVYDTMFNMGHVKEATLSQIEAIDRNERF